MHNTALDPTDRPDDERLNTAPIEEHEKTRRSSKGLGGYGNR